jgi:iron complex transport system substrate-binding protein
MRCFRCFVISPLLRTSCILVGLALLSACAFGSTRATPLSVQETTTDARVIRHALGETRIPLLPRRIVALGEEGLLADLLDAGMRPIAASVNVPEAVPLISATELAGIELFPSAAPISLERVAALQPNLIIGGRFFLEEAGYAELSRIAPTVALGASDPRQSYVETLTVFGLAERADADRAALEQAVATSAEQLRAEQRSVSLATIYPGAMLAVWVDGPTSVPLLMRELGLDIRPAAADLRGVRNGRAFLSNEQIALLDGELLILLQSASVEGEAAAIAAFQAQPIWNQIPAVQNGFVYTLDRLGYPGMRGQRALLADLAALMQQAEQTAQRS